MPLIPDPFAKFMVEVHGEAGRAWTKDLPALLDEFSERWKLTFGAPSFNLSWNYVVPAVRGTGEDVIFKIGMINPELLAEMDALAHYNGSGIAFLLDSDPERGALLLERVAPGHELHTVADDDEGTRIAAQVFQKLWKPPPATHNFPTVEDWAKGMARHRAAFNGTSGPLPQKIFETAEALFAELLPSQKARVLLHGDLHHYNILRGQREPWLAIDPKGVIGEPAYETGAFLRNPFDLYDNPDFARITAHRVDIFTEMLALERERIIGWGIAQAVLSAVWTVEDNSGGFESVIHLAEVLAKML